MIDAGGSLSLPGLSARRQLARSRSRFEKLPVAALFDIVEQVSSAAIAASPEPAKKRLEIHLCPKFISGGSQPLCKSGSPAMNLHHFGHCQ
ncbi:MULTISPECIES: hypothetical protein [unclassified Mesorhizobium]|nr:MULTISPECIES: hypothetical protein [unclassified Mesorhizobium]